ncbi:MAG: FHA domain-containing serine/threonine-protein kinase [bacterium]|nr:FHA domain-containing serine/threonine-protein kinase [bacterium]
MKRYKIISELGKGATGVVFKAVKLDDGSTVALKKLVLPGHLDANEEQEFIKRFKSEAQAALALKHPGIVAALDCGLDEGTFFIAYELVEGMTIEEALKSEREFAPEEVADIIIQAADALAYAHREGVVHRDLSPGNIFLTNEGKVRIADFGVAGFTSKETMASEKDTIVGTPGYMAPEQIKGGEVDPRSDIFSIGCVAYELLSGKQAFTGDNLAQIIHRVMNEQPKPIRELNPKVPIQLEELVFRMLAKNPDYRYQNMDEVVIAATRVLEEIPRSRKTEEMVETGHAPMLVGIAGPLEGQKFLLQPTVTTIGKKVGDIILGDEPGIAAQHAWITKEETGWVLYDADTEGGTFLNGERIEREEILPGDKIQIGSVVLEFRGAGGHKGAFQDTGVLVVQGDAIGKKAGEIPAKRVPWPVVILIMIPGILILAGLIYSGLYLPYQYRSSLDKVTNPRWDSAFSKLDATIIGR